MLRANTCSIEAKLNKSIANKCLGEETHEGEMKMKRKVLMLAGACALTVLTGCLSVTYRMDGAIPFEYFQTIKDKNERLVCFAPVLAQNHLSSTLYIITNPDDIEEAQDTLGDQDSASIRDIKKALNDLSPVAIMSSTQEMLGSAYDRDSKQMGPAEKIRLGDGIAVFSLPESFDEFFYIYIRYGADNKPDVSCGLMQLPSGPEDLFIGFSEDEDGVGAFMITDPAEIEAVYDGTTGLYGWYSSAKHKQTGFIEIGLNTRHNILHNSGQ
jgi:hypothetical protein